MIAYVDSSILLRRLFGQPNSLEDWERIDRVYASDLVKVETLRTIDRTTLRGDITPPIASDRRLAALDTIAGFQLIPISTIVLERAADPFPTPLGTLDAIHLATALQLRSEVPGLLFATHDSELAVAARSVGFNVLGA